MNCPFCNSLMISHKSWQIDACKKHNALFLMDKHDRWISICRDGYEILTMNSDELGITKLFMYPHCSKSPKESHPVVFNGYNYSEPIKEVISLNILFNIHPDNYDLLFNRLKSLVVFS